MSKLIAFVAIIIPFHLHAQVGSPRSLEYNTASVGADVRAGWSNPASLAVSPEASIMAEFRLDNPDSGSTRLGQYTLGLNSRGFSLIYQRDRFASGLTGSTWRFSIANQFSRGALGFSYTLYKGAGPSDTGYDVGIRYLAIPMVDLGFVARNIGRPTVRGVAQDLTAVGSVTLIPTNNLRISGEVLAIDPSVGGSTRMGYRALVLLASPSGKTSLVGSLGLDNNLSLGRFSLGLILGGADQGTAMASFDRLGGSTAFESVSLTGASRRRFEAPRR
jgi:hypothetical protein